MGSVLGLRMQFQRGGGLSCLCISDLASRLCLCRGDAAVLASPATCRSRRALLSSHCARAHLSDGVERPARCLDVCFVPEGRWQQHNGFAEQTSHALQ